MLRPATVASSGLYVIFGYNADARLTDQYVTIAPRPGRADPSRGTGCAVVEAGGASARGRGAAGGERDEEGEGRAPPPSTAAAAPPCASISPAPPTSSTLDSGHFDGTPGALARVQVFAPGAFGAPFLHEGGPAWERFHRAGVWEDFPLPR